MWLKCVTKVKLEGSVALALTRVGGEKLEWASKELITHRSHHYFRPDFYAHKIDKNTTYDLPLNLSNWKVSEDVPTDANSNITRKVYHKVTV